MTVEELIAELEKYDGDAEVYVEDSQSLYDPVPFQRHDGKVVL